MTTSTLETTEKLERAACALVCESGWTGATSRAIAQRAGVNMALINYHFRSKDGLILAALNRAMTELGAMGPPPTSIVELHQMVRAFAGGQGSVPALQMLFQASLRGARDPAVAEVVKGHLDDFRALIIGALSGPGSASIGADFALLAHAIAAFLDGLVLHALIDPAMDLGGVVDAFFALLAPPAVP